MSAPGASLKIALLGLSALAYAAAASAQGEDKVKAGLEVWRSSGCADCHGSFANGAKPRDEAPSGANLRTSTLDATALKEVISCGRPVGTGMPSFDEGAYKVRPCSGQLPGAAPGNLYPAPRTLTLDQIDAVVFYLQARIVGKGRITRAECLAYYDGDEDECEDYK